MLAPTDARLTPPLRLALGLSFLAVALYRLSFCFAPPAETTDLIRNLGLGRNFWIYGFRLYDLKPPELLPLHGWEVLWPDQSYEYPVVALWFFALLARLSTSLVVARVVLTAIELANAVLVQRLTGSRLLALAWFASPASTWWVSGEGQFEPVAALASLLALDALRRGRYPAAYVLLGLAVQVKVLPLLLLPVFLIRARNPRALAAFAASFLPSLPPLLASGYLGRWLEPGFRPSGFNPLAWNVVSGTSFAWVPGWLRGWNGLLTLGLVLAAAWLALAAGRRRDWAGAMGYVPILLLLIAIKSAPWAMFWYLLLVPVFALAITDPGPRAALFLVSLLEGRGSSALLLGPVGNDWAQWFSTERWLHGGA